MAADRAQIPDKEEEALGVELLGPVKHKLAVTKPDRPKVADALAGRVMVNHRNFDLSRNPHATP